MIRIKEVFDTYRVNPAMERLITSTTHFNDINEILSAYRLEELIKLINRLQNTLRKLL